jgi:hypothetical protein
LIAFALFAEIFLVSLAHPPNSRRKFNGSFIPAFIVYAIVWSACWFALHLRAREWIGSALGCAAFATILYRRLGAREGLCKVILFLIVAHSAGYFLGGRVFFMALPRSAFASWPKQDVLMLAKLTWGLFYGLGFGAGMGYAFDVFQRAAPAKQA